MIKDFLTSVYIYVQGKMYMLSFFYPVNLSRGIIEEHRGVAVIVTLRAEPQD